MENVKTLSRARRMALDHQTGMRTVLCKVTRCCCLTRTRDPKAPRSLLGSNRSPTRRLAVQLPQPECGRHVCATLAQAL